MRIICPHCVTPYQVAPRSLGERGRSVKCARCQTVWFAKPTENTDSDFQPAFESSPPQADLPVRHVSAGFNPPDLPAREPFGSELKDQPPADPPPTETVPSVETAPAETPPAAGEPLAPSPQAPLPQAPLPELTGDLTSAQAGDFTVPFTAPTHPAPLEIDVAPSIVPAETREDETIEPPAPTKTTRRGAAHKSGKGWMRLPRLNRTFASLPVTILVLLALVAALIGWRQTIVRVAPQTASLYGALGLPVNLRGVVFKGVKTARENVEGVSVLVVEGQLVNVTSKPVEVPRLRMSLRNTHNGEIYSWTTMPTRPVLNAGEALSFRSRLASPPSDTHEVQVRFFNRQDALAGVK